MDFAVQAGHRLILKDSEKGDKYLDLAKELTKLWNMKMTVIPIITGGYGRTAKWYVKRPKDLKMRGQVEIT